MSPRKVRTNVIELPEISVNESESKRMEAENTAYDKFLDLLIKYADGKEDGVKARLMIAGASAVVKRIQSRSANQALRYQISRDLGRKYLKIKQKQIAA